MTPDAGKGKFTVRRIVNWGDCDPAGIVYTPRVLDYACETIDAFLREELNASWWQVKSSGNGPGLPTVNAVCDFISIVRPDQSLELSLHVREIGRSSIAFEGRNGGGQPSGLSREAGFLCHRSGSLPPDANSGLDAR